MGIVQVAVLCFVVRIVWVFQLFHLGDVRILFARLAQRPLRNSPKYLERAICVNATNRPFTSPGTSNRWRT
jgi:hypothetical protein